MIDYSQELRPIQGLSQSQIEASQVQFMQKVYGWMVVGLGLTGLLAYYIYESGAWLSIAPYSIYIGLATLGLVFYLSFRIHKMSAMTATGVFIAYALLNGLFFSSIFAAYEMGAIYNAFFVSAGAFVALSVYGFTTKKDLSAFGKFLFMGLVGIILVMLINTFLIQSSLFDTTISIIGVLLFAGLTAYDTQRLKNMHHFYMQNNELARKGAIMGALALYLDFINMFLFMLRLLGGRD
ncbi:Bax inhibitor-1/YccA family protein [bacterium]|nr:MAG: Bax inhibitor-1/YccA family protein [bacterium]